MTTVECSGCDQELAESEAAAAERGRSDGGTAHVRRHERADQRAHSEDRRQNAEGLRAGMERVLRQHR